MPSYILSKLTAVARHNRLSPQELAQVLQQVYVQEHDGSKTLLVPIRDSYVSKACISTYFDRNLAQMTFIKTTSTQRDSASFTLVALPLAT